MCWETHPLFIIIVKSLQKENHPVVQAYKYKQMSYKNLDKYVNTYYYRGVKYANEYIGGKNVRVVCATPAIGLAGAKNGFAGSARGAASVLVYSLR